MRLLQKMGLDRIAEKIGLLKLMPGSLRQMHDMVPRLKPHYGTLPEVLPAEGKKRARVALFTGCAGDAFLPQTTVATARVLQRNGCEVWVPRGQVCCGALHYHSSQEEPAQRFAETNCKIFRPDEVDAIITNAAGCGAMLKDYPHLLHDTNAAKAFTAKVRDISEFLMELGPIKPEHPLKLRAVYHDACHLCHAQQIRKQPRQLLEMIPGLELLPLAETEICCGAAGSYNITQPEMARKLLDRKIAAIKETGATIIATGNPGCLAWIQQGAQEQGLNLRICHPIELLDEAYD